MEQTFNIHRFLRLFVKHTAEHYKTYLMSVAVLIGLLVLGGSFLTYIVNEPIELNAQAVIFVMLFFLACAVFTSSIFADYGDKRKAASSLMLPASPLEKFMVAWVWSYLLFSIVFIASFYLVLFSLMNVRHWPGHHAQFLNIFAQPAVSLFIPFSFVHGFTLFGAIYFNRLHFIKTGFVFFATVAVLVLANTFFMEGLLGREVRAVVPFSDLAFMDGSKFYSINITDKYSAVVMWLIMAAAVLLWVAAYFRLKEKQA